MPEKSVDHEEKIYNNGKKEKIMAKVLVMYFSKYGTTKKYAEWIASELNGDIFDMKKIKQNILNNYDTIILGSGLYAGNIGGINILLENYETLKGKKIILFTCGLADYNKTENINAINKRICQVIPENIRRNIKVYFLRGGIDYKKLNLKHKIMMGLLKKMTMKKGIDKMNDEDKEFIETYGKTVDFTDKNSIKEIIEYSEK
jgi:menaquinone-dependent protoporphyrinogen IX oxidase